MASKRLEIDEADFVIAMTTNSEGAARWFLDLESGKIGMDFDGVSQIWSSYGVDSEDMDDDDIDFDTQQYLEITDAIVSHDSFQLMEDFASSVTNPSARQALERAIEQRRPFRHFKDALYAFPEIQKQWFEFEAREKVRLAKEWLKMNDIDAVLVKRTS